MPSFSYLRSGTETKLITTWPSILYLIIHSNQIKSFFLLYSQSHVPYQHIVLIKDPALYIFISLKHLALYLLNTWQVLNCYAMDKKYTMIFLTYSPYSFLVINSEEIYSTIFSNCDNFWAAAHNTCAWCTATGRTAWTCVVVSRCPLLAD